MFPRVAGPGSGRAYLLLQELLLLVDSGEQRVQRVQVGGTLQLVVQVVLHADIHVVLSSSPSPLTALDGRRCLSIVHEWIKPVYSNT